MYLSRWYWTNENAGQISVVSMCMSLEALCCSWCVHDWNYVSLVSFIASWILAWARLFLTDMNFTQRLIVLCVCKGYSFFKWAKEKMWEKTQKEMRKGKARSLQFPDNGWTCITLLFTLWWPFSPVCLRNQYTMKAVGWTNQVEESNRRFGFDDEVLVYKKCVSFNRRLLVALAWMQTLKVECSWRYSLCWYTLHLDIISITVKGLITSASVSQQGLLSPNKKKKIDSSATLSVCYSYSW